MLSFDITDKNIRIIKGTESNNKIKITSAAEIELDEAVIVNGHVNDPNRVAGKINQTLKQANIADKEAIVSISSNQTVFKELMVAPNPKESEFMKNVRMELQNQINIDDSYSVGYVIIGQPEQDENGESLQKILATACPRDVIDSYRRIFNMLNITLKSVMIGCNAITKILLADAKTKAKMPFLAVQIDPNFISLNLYEDDTLSFSRFASIDPEDYDNPDDYIFEAVNENIFRMIQFARIRGSETIENIVFYGDTNASQNLYPRLVDEMGKNDLNVSQLNVPPQIHGYQNLEFPIYANAIGAMFKRDKLTEHINLLENDAAQMGVVGKVQDDRSFNIIAAVGIGLSVVVVAAVFAVIASVDAGYVSKTNDLRAEIDSPETAAKLKQYEDLLEKRDIVNVYKTTVTNASAAYKSLPVLDVAVYDALDEAIVTVKDETDGVDEDVIISDISYSDGELSVPFEVISTQEFGQDYPSALVAYLYDTYGESASGDDKLFSDVSYEGYDVSDETDENGNTVSKVSFQLTLSLVSPETPEIIETEPETEAAAEADDTSAEE